MNLNFNFWRKAHEEKSNSTQQVVAAPVIFLDFDGVLHIRQRGTLDRIALLEAFLHAHPTVQVVISSTWRMQESLEELALYFAPSLRCRIEGVTPIGTQTPYSRFLEIQTYLAGERRLWCALDDEGSLFPPDCPQLVLCDTSVALTLEHLVQVEKILQLAPRNMQ